MEFIKDDKGQGAAEMVLLAGGIIVVALVALAMYNSYASDLGEGVENESQSLTDNISALGNKFK